MAEEKLKMEREVLEALGGGKFRVMLDNGHSLIAYTAGRMRRYRIPWLPETVSVSRCDLRRNSRASRLPSLMAYLSALGFADMTPWWV